MKSSELKPQHQTSVIGRMLDIRNQIIYLKNNVIPFSYKMEKWEYKEYSLQFNNYKQELDELSDYIYKNESLFNEILSNYNLSVSVFINKYILMCHFN